MSNVPYNTSSLSQATFYLLQKWPTGLPLPEKFEFNNNFGLKMLELLLHKGANVNDVQNNMTLLMQAILFIVMFENIDTGIKVLKLLLDNGAKPHQGAKEYKNAFDFLSRFSNVSFEDDKELITKILKDYSA